MRFLLLRRLALPSGSLTGSERFIRNLTPLNLLPLPSFFSSSSFPGVFSGASKRLVPILCLKPISNNHPFALKANGFSSIHDGNAPPPEEDENQMLYSHGSMVLKRRLTELGFDTEACIFGRFNRLLCPMCDGGDSAEKSLSLFINQNGVSAWWMCFRAKCGWEGNTRAFADPTSSYKQLRQSERVKPKREITMELLELEPLCDEILAYFAERMISAETLRRNAVMQKRCGKKVVIAFTYRHKGVLISCKYRDVMKKFWQERDTEKIFYGLDDIENASDIIIVEGEIDKLSMEEAGFRNCVSVPGGAPPSVSKELPNEEQDTRYQYLWNCKKYFEKASRIILATDGDPPGQALAEELARRVGRERCWRVRWPKRNAVDYMKDANEVLMYLGPTALRDVIKDAELYPIKGLFQFRDYFDDIDAYYQQNLGHGNGVSTVQRALDAPHSLFQPTKKT